MLPRLSVGREAEAIYSPSICKICLADYKYVQGYVKQRHAPVIVLLENCALEIVMISQAVSPLVLLEDEVLLLEREDLDRLTFHGCNWTWRRASALGLARGSDCKWRR